MINNHHGNERRPYNPHPQYGYGSQTEERPRVQETVHATAVSTAERKTYQMEHRENGQGQFVRIVETCASSSRRSTLIVPLVGLPDFIAALQKVGKVPAA